MVCYTCLSVDVTAFEYYPGAAADAGPLYNIILGMQLFFYLVALSGWFFANRDIKIKALYMPYYFLFMNISVIWGFKRFLKGQQSVLWEKAARGKAV